MKEEVPILEYNEATIESRGNMIPIRLKLSDQGINFKNSKTGKMEDISSSDLEVVNWQRLAGGYGVRVFTQNGNLYRFGNFKESDQSKLEKFFKNNLKKTMTDKEYSVKGWNYGSAKFEGAVLSFDIGSTPAFEIPLRYVSSCNTGKNEVTMEFHQHDDTAVALMEMRYHLPTSELSGDEPVEDFKKRVMAKASVITATGDALAIFREIQCVTPRGRYDIKVYPSFIQLHGKTYDFKIPIETVQRLFLMPHQDQRQHYFVVSLDPPIKQGQTRYPYLILQFAEDADDTVELPLSEEEIKEKYEGRLEKELSGPTFEIISRLFKGLRNCKIVTPGNFVGHSGTPAISCSYKAASGYLYPLERGIIYIYKPPLYIKFDEISSVNFARSGSTTRSFDFEVELRTGVINTFSSIDKNEYSKLYEYVTSKKLRVKNRKEMESFGRKDYGDGKEPDHYMNRVRAEAEERDDDDDDEESEEDSDFNPDAGEDSDVKDEFDSNASDTSEDSDEDAGSDAGGGGGGEKKRKEKSERKEKPKKAKTVSEKPRKKRTKKDKDENKPKRPQSAYFLWLNENREKIKKDNPGISITEVSKKAGELWRGITDKTKWEEKAAEEKKKYEVAMKEYIASGGGGSTGSSKKSGKGSKPASKKVSISPTKAGSGVGFKSKEYISDSSSDDGGDDEDEKPKKKAKTESKPSKKNKKEKEESADEEEEEEDDDDEEEEESSAASSGDDSD